MGNTKRENMSHSWICCELMLAIQSPNPDNRVFKSPRAALKAFRVFTGWKGWP